MNPLLPALLACRPDPEPVATGPSAPAPARARRHDGGWFTLEVPAELRPAPLEGPARDRYALRLRSEAPAEVEVLIARPRGLPAGTPEGAPDDSTVGHLITGLSGLGQPLREPSRLAGVDAVQVHLASRAVDGRPAEAAAWFAVRSGHLLSVTCAGTGEGMTLAAKVCPALAESFAVGEIGALAADPEGALEPQHLGPLQIPIPAHWRRLDARELEPQALGGYGPPIASAGPVDFYRVTAHLFKGELTNERLAASLEAGGIRRIVSSEDVASGLGPGRVTELTDGVAHAWVFDTVLQGAGVEVRCEAPERFRNEMTPRCEAVFGGLALSPRR